MPQTTGWCRLVPSRYPDHCWLRGNEYLWNLKKCNTFHTGKCIWKWIWRQFYLDLNVLNDYTMINIPHLKYHLPQEIKEWHGLWKTLLSNLTWLPISTWMYFGSPNASATANVLPLQIQYFSKPGDTFLVLPGRRNATACPAWRRLGLPCAALPGQARRTQTHALGR